MSQGDYPTLQVAALLGLSSRNIPTCVDCRARATAHRLSSVTVSVPPQPPLPRCVLYACGAEPAPPLEPRWALDRSELILIHAKRPRQCRLQCSVCCAFLFDAGD